TTQAAVFADDRLRNACKGIYAASELRRPGIDTRHLPRTRSENSLSPRLRCVGGRTASRVSVSSAGVPPGARQLLGLCARPFFRATPGVQFSARSPGRGGRISRYGQVFAPSRD